MRYQVSGRGSSIIAALLALMLALAMQLIAANRAEAAPLHEAARMTGSN